MEAALLIIHLVLAIALVVVILLQRSEGGALGIGGGGGMMSIRGAASVLTRSTTYLAVVRRPRSGPGRGANTPTGAAGGADSGVGGDTPGSGSHRAAPPAPQKRTPKTNGFAQDRIGVWAAGSDCL